MQIYEQHYHQEVKDQQHGLYIPQWRMDQREARLLAFEKRMFELSSRHLILVLTLTYKDDVRRLITPDHIAADRDRLFENARNNTALRDMMCIWKIEEGGHGGGMHMHLIVFYDGSKKSGYVYADYIGQYWEQVVTRGWGDFFNSNAKAAEYERGSFGNFTGQIDRHDGYKRSLLCEYLCNYIAKDSQMIASMVGTHYRTMGMSRLP